MTTVDRGRLTSGYGYQSWRDYVHAGIDVAGIRPATTPPIYAAADGRVAFIGWDLVPGRNGQHLGIRHPEGSLSFYGHLDRPIVRKGDRVRRGQAIATMGRSGLAPSVGIHLHFEHWRTAAKSSTHQDPHDWLACHGWVFSTEEPGRLSNVNAVWDRYFTRVGVTRVDTHRGIQLLLADAGLYTGLIDGILGKMSIVALQRLLTRHGSYRGAIDGQRGPYTCRAELTYLGNAPTPS